jgi:hypothetical protein
MRLAGVLVFAVAFAGCNVGPNTRVNTYTPLGQFQPTESDRVSREYTASLARPAPDYDVAILNSSFPPGVGLVDGHIVTTPDALYQPIADFQLGFRLDDSAPTQSELTPYLKRFAKAAKANMLVISIHQRPDLPIKVDYVEGFAFRSRLADQNGQPKLDVSPESPSHSL